MKFYIRANNTRGVVMLLIIAFVIICLALTGLTLIARWILLP